MEEKDGLHPSLRTNSTAGEIPRLVGMDSGALQAAALRSMAIRIGIAPSNYFLDSFRVATTRKLARSVKTSALTVLIHRTC